MPGDHSSTSRWNPTGVKKKIAWKPYSFYFMDLRPDNLAFS